MLVELSNGCASLRKWLIFGWFMGGVGGGVMWRGQFFDGVVWVCDLMQSIIAGVSAVIHLNGWL